MILEQKYIQFIKQHQVIIGEILVKLIEDRKNQIIDEEDPEKRDKLINWVKELRVGQMILRKTGQHKKKDNFSGI